MAITTILSDLGNVVVFFDNAKAAREMAAIVGRSADAVELALFRDYDICHRYSRGDFGTPEFLGLVCERLGIPPMSPRNEARLAAAFADVFTPNSPVVARWETLRRAGVTLTAVSNIEELRWRQLERQGVLSPFDHLVMSCEERLMKPSADLMLRALDRSGAKAEETLFVDDIAENLPPAASLGIHTHLYRDVASLDACLASYGLIPTAGA